MNLAEAKQLAEILEGCDHAKHRLNAAYAAYLESGDDSGSEERELIEAATEWDALADDLGDWMSDPVTLSNEEDGFILPPGPQEDGLSEA